MAPCTIPKMPLEYVKNSIKILTVLKSIVIYSFPKKNWRRRIRSICDLIPFRLLESLECESVHSLYYLLLANSISDYLSFNKKFIFFLFETIALPSGIIFFTLVIFFYSVVVKYIHIYVDSFFFRSVANE